MLSKSLDVMSCHEEPRVKRVTRKIRPRADWNSEGLTARKQLETTLYIANVPEISRNVICSQKSTPAGGKQQSRQKPANTPLSFSPGEACERSKRETSTGLQQQRPPSAQARPRPRPSRSRQDLARAAEVRTSKAPSCSSATRSRVHSPVPVVAPPSRGNTPEGWISGTGG